MSRKKNTKDIVMPHSKQANLSHLSPAYLIPPSIFRKNPLSILEAVVKFLKEEKKLSYHDIGVLLNRDERNIWTVYSRVLNKQKIRAFAPAHPDPSDILIPVEVFRDRTLCTLEVLSAYLKDTMNLNYHQIGIMLDRDERNIWTVYQRSRKKKGNKQKEK